MTPTIPSGSIEQLTAVWSQHITEQDMELMRASDGTIYQDRFGIMAFALEWTLTSEEVLKAQGYSDAFVTLMEAVREAECAWIQIDAMNPGFDGFRAFDWEDRRKHKLPAKDVHARLTAEFPGVDFRVGATEYHDGTSHIEAAWTGGPDLREVMDVLAPLAAEPDRGYTGATCRRWPDDPKGLPRVLQL